MRLIDADALERAVMMMSDDDLCEDCCYNVVNAIDEMPTIGGWISVNERLPENGQFVVVRHEVKGRIYSEVAHYIMDLWWLDWNSNGLELKAISWMPLPEPPKEVTRDV